MTATLLLVLSSAWGQEEVKPGQAVSPAPAIAAKADPEAVKTMDKAIQVFDPAHLGWLETTLWQQVSAPTRMFEAQGRYLLAPDYRRRLDLKVQVGDASGEMQVVSDGANVWEMTNIAHYGKGVRKTELKKILDGLNQPGITPLVLEQVREEYLQGSTLSGITPLLQNLKRQLVFTKQEPGKWQTKDVLILVGVWSPEMSKDIAPPDRWPMGLPRTCRVYVDASTFWPYRLEWWGPLPGRTEDLLLMQMEYRDPVIGKPGEKPPESFAKAFTFDPGETSVVDNTKDVAEGVRARVQQLSRQREALPGTKQPALPQTKQP